METAGIDWIEIRDLQVWYPQRIILDIPRLRFESGRVYMVVGRMGSGKSTLLSVIAGLKKYRGEIVFSRSISPKDVGLAFQHPSSMFFMPTVWDEVCVAVRRYGLSEQLCELALERFDVPRELWYADPFTLSGSEARRVALAAAFAHNPSVILMDEPTAGMDCGVVNTVLKFARDMSDAGKLVIMVTHSPEESMLADVLLVLSEGKVIYSGEPQGFWTDMRTVVNSGLLPPEGFLWRRFADGQR